MARRGSAATSQAESGGGAPKQAAPRHDAQRGRRTRQSTLTTLFAAPWLTLLSLRRVWRPLALVGVGVIVAVMVICMAPLYTAIIGDAQIAYTLHNSPPTYVNVEADATMSGVVYDDTTAAAATLQSMGRKHFGAYSSSDWEYLSSTFLLSLSKIGGKDPYSVDPALPPVAYFSAYAFDYTAALPHMTVIAGRIPQDTSVNSLPEVMVTPKLGVKPGQTMQLQAGGAPRGQGKVDVRVVGVWAPKDANDPFWNGAGFDTTLPSATTESAPSYFPVLFTRTGFLRALDFFGSATFGQPTGLVIHYIALTNPDSISSNSLNSVTQALAALHNDVNGNLLGTNGVLEVNVTNGLTGILNSLQQQAAVLALPLDVVAGQIAGLALLFIAAMTAQLVEGQSSAIATLKTRGASSSQILSLYVTQGLVLGVIAVAVGPLLAATLSVYLVTTLTPITSGGGGVSAVYLARAATPQSVLVPAAVGAVASVAAMALATLSAARFDILAFRRAQARDGVPFWRRYYLDIALAILCVVGYVELGQFGGLNVRAQLGLTTSVGPDPLQLVTPGLLLIAGALVALRLFPVAAGIGARLAARGRGVVGALTFAQLARASSRFTRLTLVLTLGVGLGLFALTFQTSLARNASDRAAYEVGGDERVTFADYLQGEGLPYPLAPLFGREPGVTTATPVYRAAGVLTNSDQSTTQLNVLAIDPTTFAQTAYWRSDYASQPLPSLLRALTAHTLTGRAVPTDQLGATGQPIAVLVSATFAAIEHVRSGDRFVMQPNEGDFSFAFVVVGVVNEFPTMYNDAPGGYIIANMKDYFNALNAEGLSAVAPTEYWLRTTTSATATAQRANDYRSGTFFFVSAATDRRALLAQYQSDPLTSGMTSLLLVGAFTAALLAALGSVAQLALEARRRGASFAILRTLGVSRRQITASLLGEQLFMDGFGLLTGAALGLLLSTATLPLLQYSSEQVDPTTLGVPPFVIAFNPTGSAIFFGALLLAFALSLALGVWLAVSGGLGATLRLGED